MMQQPRTERSIKILAVCAMLMFVMASVRDVRAESISDMGEAAKHIQKNVQALRGRYLQKDSYHGEHYAEARLIDGETLYKLGDYHRASIVLLDILENYSGHPTVPEALFYYADSLFQARDFYGARTEFERLVQNSNAPGYAAFRAPSIARLVEVAIHLHDFSGVSQYIDLIGDRLDAQARYVKGKYLYFQESYDAARGQFAAVSDNLELQMKAAYFIGASYVKEMRLDEAAEAFGNAATAFAKVDAAHRDLLDLLNLGLGRVLYEKDFVENAIAAYDQISKYSPYYDVALYEAAAVQMRAGNTIGAERMLEILTLAIPESRYIPKAKLLRGHLLSSAGRYDEAEQVFEQTIEEFSPVQQLMDEALAQSGGTGEFFELLMARSMDTLNIQSIIPTEVVTWAGEEPEVKRAFVLTDDLAKAREYTGESERLAALIGAVVNGINPVNAIPMLRSAMRQNQIFRNQLCQLTARLMVEAEDEFDGGKIGQWVEDRIRLGNQVASLPTSEKGFKDREKKARQVFDDMRRELRRYETMLDKMLAVVVGLERYVSKPEYRVGMPEQTIESYMEQLARYRAGAESLRENMEALKVDIEKAIYQIGIGGERDLADAQVTDRLFEMARMYASVIPASTRTSRRLSAAFDAVAAAEQEIRALSADIEAQAQKKVAEIRIELGAEQAKIEQYKAELDALRGEAKEVVNGVAKENFSGIRARFHQLLLKADVGIIDIAWMRKEEHKSRAVRLSKQRTYELTTMERDFAEVEGFADETADE
ncbi:MAG: hypothetical protein JXX29_18050 [Deltaproteobacteria bacterium]|nr:hypothetical protein [Deltaproteobacteria bacterium]MBN2673590.1 hypothetical protein [Deltaproteobacteria bacterium]